MGISNLIEVHQEVVRVLMDGGPLYHETNLHHFIVEPWNAYSSLAFLVPAIYWLIKLRGQYRDYQFLMYCIPFLILGGLGSTFYHAFRSSVFFLVMDVLPISILTLSVGIYFWYKILPQRWHVLIIIATFLGLRILTFTYFEGQMGINLSYFVTGVMMFTPGLILLIRTDFYYYQHLILSVILFAIGLSFRKLDTMLGNYFPMGTHWLWHIFTAAAVMPLSFYLEKIRAFEASLSTVDID